LILVNGSNNTDELKWLSLFDNVVEILETLSAGKFINTSPTSATAVAAQDYGLQ
jgi:hypothetical protein